MSNKLKEFRKSKYLTQAKLAEALGVSENLIVSIEMGRRNLSLKLINKIKEVYGVNLFAEEPNNSNENIIAIPLYNVSAAAGKGTWLLDSSDKDVMYFDKRFLNSILRTDKYNSLHLIYAKGDSMDSGWNQPTDIKDGDLLMIDTSQTTGNSKVFVILVNNTELRVKRLFKIGEVLHISSNNPKYKEEVYYPNESDIEIKIIGRVIWNGSKENV